jgi:hypothetical protein
MFAVALGLGGHGGRGPKRARILAARLAATGAGSTPELRSLLDDPLSRTVNYASLILMLAIVVLMVFK